MAGGMTLIVRFRMDEGAKAEFTAKLKGVFAHMEKEETFVQVSLLQDGGNPRRLMVYEVRRETPESFIKK